MPSSHSIHDHYHQITCHRPRSHCSIVHDNNYHQVHEHDFMMIANIQMISLVTDLVPIVPVKTVDNAPANLLLAFPHRSLPGLEEKDLKW